MSSQMLHKHKTTETSQKKQIHKPYAVFSHKSSLNSSRVQNKQLKNKHPKHLRLSGSFYNDGKNIYLRRSQLISDSSRSFQARDLSFSERKKYETEKLEHLLEKRKRANTISRANSLESTQAQCLRAQLINPEASKKYNLHSQKKYNQLISRSKDNLLRKKMLQKDIKENKPNTERKWSSPFRNTEDCRQNIKEKSKSSKMKILGNSDKQQLKVTNIDRMFRSKQGKLTNIVPIPMPSMKGVLARKEMLLRIKQKDKIHNIVGEYNALLKMMKVARPKNLLGVKGKKFEKEVTLQDLVGIKLHPSKHPTPQDSDYISQQVFAEHCYHYRNKIKKNPQLTQRLIRGLMQSSNVLDLTAFARFYSIFVNKTASNEEKINFLLYFFIPKKQGQTTLETVKLVAEIMCRELPSISMMNKLKTDLLTPHQKSSIFLQALNRVLFESNVFQNQSLNHSSLNSILSSNIDAVDLLIQLLQCKHDAQ